MDSQSTVTAEKIKKDYRTLGYYVYTQNILTDETAVSRPPIRKSLVEKKGDVLHLIGIIQLN